MAEDSNCREPPKALEAKLTAAFNKRIRTGERHPSQDILEKELRASPAETRARLASWYASNKNSRYSLLLILSRLPSDLGCGPETLGIAAKGLQSGKLEIRSAAVLVLERWGGEEAIKLLRSRREPVIWLDSFIRKVIEDLSQRTRRDQ